MANEVVQLNPLPTVQQQTTVRTSSILANPEQVKVNMRAAELFAQSDLVPTHYRNKPANCFIAINRAQRLGIDEMYFLEKTFIVGGKLGMAAELAIELANASGRFRGQIKFRLFGEGEARGCTAFATLASDGETVENTVTYAMAKADGWTKNNKWNSLRDQMLQYRAGVFLTRLYAGGALGGMYTREELEDVAAQSNKHAGTVQAEQRTAIAPPDIDPPANEDGPDIEAFEADVKSKLDAIKTTDGLDDLWQSGIGARAREIGGVDKKAQQRIIAAFSQKKNEILKAIEEDAEAGETPEATDEAPQDAPHASLTAEQEAVVDQVITGLGVDRNDTVVTSRDRVPPPVVINLEDDEQGHPRWNRFYVAAKDQLQKASDGEYGEEWLVKWLELNGGNIPNLTAHNEKWGKTVAGFHRQLLDYFRTQREEAAAPEHST